MKIRTAVMADLPAMMELYAFAQGFMARHGNPNQWGTEYPSEAIVKEDIESGFARVCEEEGRLLAAFLLAPGPDPDYGEIREGEWMQPQRPYWVIHRLASYGSPKGVGTFCLDWCWQQQKNLRVDTHRDNRPMQGLLQKCGFSRRGVIHCRYGGERIAFQKTE